MRQDFYKHAKNMSLMSDFHKCHTGCVVVYKNKIIGTGFNTSKTHPIQRKYNSLRYNCDATPHSMHAETNALIPILDETDINWSKVHIYTYREYKTGNTALSRPCKSCMQLIKDLGIKNIHYTSCDGYVHEELHYT